MAELFRYAAFVSYSSKDAAFARRLHQALESYGIPSSLGKFDLIGGGKANRIYPVFRDREELSAGQLGDQIEANLRASASLIVVCSPNGAASPWVQKEIEYFAGLGRHAKIFTIIPANVPLTDQNGGDCTPSCFPPAFRGVALAGDKFEPLAADARKGKDGFRNAWLKLVAGMIGVTPGQLIDRDKKRRRQQRVAIGAGALVLGIVLALVGAFIDARSWRSDMTGHANDITSKGRALEAVSFAIGGLPARGDAIMSTHADAEPALVRTSAPVRILIQLGWIDFDYSFSSDGRFLLTRDQDSNGALLDLSDPASAPRPLGPVERSTHRFSEDGRLLVTTDAHGNGTLRDLRDPAAPPRPLGRLGYGTYDFSEDGRYLLTRDPDANGTLRDLRELAVAPRPLGRLDGFGPASSFSEDSSFLVTRHADGNGMLRDLRDPAAAPRTLGQVTERGFGFSRDSRFLLTQAPDGAGVLRDLRNSAAPPRSLGRLDNVGFGFSGDSRFLLTVDPEGSAELRDLRNAAASPRPLGRLGAAIIGFTFRFSGNGRFLLTGDPTGNGALRDLHNPAVAQRPLGQLGPFGFRFSRDSRFLATMDPSDNGALHDLRDPAAAPRPLGRLARNTFHFSDDGRFLATTDADGDGALRDLSDPAAAPRPLGRLGGSFGVGFSGDGKFLVTVDPEGSGTLRDLRAPSPQSSGATDICRASGDTIRPFPRALRLGQEPQTRHLTRRLVGRPWNPCDWRGILAIFPSAERGDGWLEGARQWWRLMLIRNSHSPDWTCEQTTSRASDTTRKARRDMCDRFAPEAVAGE